jgi:TRAP-type C4-dicarboxylate transport system permease small subunit
MTAPRVAQPVPPSPARTWALYFATLGGMAAAFFNEQIQYLLVALSCGRHDSWTRLWLFLTPAILLIVSLVAVWVGWQYWTSNAHDAEDELPPAHETVRAEREGDGVDARVLDKVKRIRFMGLLGAGLSAFSALGIIYMSLPLFYLSPCDFT